MCQNMLDATKVIFWWKSIVLKCLYENRRKISNVLNFPLKFEGEGGKSIKFKANRKKIIKIIVEINLNRREVGF